MKKFVTLLFLVIFLSLPLAGTAFAGDNNPPPAPSFVQFTPPASDISLNYLKSMFGLVDGVLHSSGSQILGKLFKIFNLAVLSLGGIVLMYTFIVSTVNTAQEGEVMGKKWSSVWIPLRSVLGIALLVPKASGYSMIQILFMWIVVQGIGAADSVWNTALNYLGNGGTIISTSQDTLGSEGQRKSFDKVLNFTGDALQQMVCMYAVQNELEKARAANPNARSPVPSFLDNTVPLRDLSQTSVAIPTFPSVGPPPYAEYEKVCGSITWTPINAPQGREEVRNARSLAVQQVLLTLASAARPIVYSNAQRNDNDYYANALLNAALDYQAIVTPALQAASGRDDRFSKQLDQSGGSFNRPRDWMAEMKQGGWIMAGSYFEIITRQHATELAEATPPTTTGLGSEVIGRLKSIDSTLFTDWSTPSVNIWNSLEATRGAVSKARGKANVAQGGKEDANPLADLDKAGPIGIGVKNFLGAFNGVNTSNPITALAIQGKNMILAATYVWTTVSLTSINLTAIAAAVPFVALGTVMNAVNQWIVPITTSLTTLCLMSGATLAYYIPLLPFFIFTLAAIGWIVSVLEAIIAAPLVALALMHPEGDETFGKATPAIMMIVSVFLKPVLIIIGYIGAIMMVYVGLWLLNKGFDAAWSGAVTMQDNAIMKSGMGTLIAGGLMTGFVPIGLFLPQGIMFYGGIITLVVIGVIKLILQTMFSVYIVQKVFAAGISDLHTHVLIYLGQQGQPSPISAGAEAAEQKAEAAGGKLGGTGALGGAQRGMDYGKPGSGGSSTGTDNTNVNT